MSRALNDLTPQFRAQVFEFLARCTEAGIPVMILDTLRTKAEQEVNVAKGVSWTMNSKHLPQEPDGKSQAIDICPYETYQIAGPDKLQWNASDPVWLKLGEIGEKVGMVWGGRWKTTPDLGHFEFKRVAPAPKPEGFVA